MAKTAGWKSAWRSTVARGLDRGGGFDHRPRQRDRGIRSTRLKSRTCAIPADAPPGEGLINCPDAGASAESSKRRADHQPAPHRDRARGVDHGRHHLQCAPLAADPERRKQIETDSGVTVRLLEVISAPAEPPGTPPPETADLLRNFKAGPLFLIDTTESMQPYIDATLAAVKALIAQIGRTPLWDKFRFGVVGYRDSLLDTPRAGTPRACRCGWTSIYRRTRHRPAGAGARSYSFLVHLTRIRSPGSKPASRKSIGICSAAATSS